MRSNVDKFGKKSLQRFFLNLSILRLQSPIFEIRKQPKIVNLYQDKTPKQGTMKPELKRIRKVEYDIDPNRYELRSGSETNAPLCPYGNIYKWVVFDLKANEYVRFAKSVFKLLINKNGK